MNNNETLKVIESRYGNIVTDGGEDLIIKSLNMYGEWANNEIDFLKKIIKKGDTVLDVGTYLGTHLIAFSQFVGETGQVLGFEPQKFSYDLVSETVKINACKNVHIHNFALGREYEVIDANQGEEIQSHNRGSFSLRSPKGTETLDVDNGANLVNVVSAQTEDSLTATNSEGDSYGIIIQSLDSLGLNIIDFMKIDAEGMESDILYGGIETITKTKPVIFCECNDLSNGNEIYNWTIKYNYKIIAINIPAFNSDNFRFNSEDFFSGASEVSLVLYPPEKEHLVEMASRGHRYRNVLSVNDIYLVLLTKSQFIDELNQPEKNILDNNKFDIFKKRLFTNFDVPEKRLVNGVVIGVPFYKGPELVRPLFDSLAACAKELNTYNVKIVFYNDSPDYEPLNIELEALKSQIVEFSFEIFTNIKNLGFIGTTNQSIEYAISLGYDLIMLNSDTIFFPGVIRELIEVAYADPMIAFVSPRSNNATICTFPHNAKNELLSPKDAWQQYMNISCAFPRYSFVPTCVGFCLFIKNRIMHEFGGLDDIYGRGYNEENDFIMRANRCGYGAVLANHAFVWHEGEKSFSGLDSKKDTREEINAKILHKRYPEFPHLIRNYFSSTEYRSEEILSGILPDAYGNKTIAFEFSSLGTYHNGTFEAGKRLIIAADQCWPDNYNIVIICGEDSWDFHALKQYVSSRVTWCDPSDYSVFYAAVIRIGQPFSPASIAQMIYRAPVVSCFMLDTIAADCGYLKIDFDENIWRFTLNWLDVIFTNSFYTASQFFRRYKISPNTIVQPTLHSVSLDDYYDKKNTNDIVNDFISNYISNDGRKILLIGNKFSHKGLASSVPLVSDALPQDNILVLGGENYEQSNVKSIPTGQMSDDEINILYDLVDVIIFPSHYEGFGFPLLHSLAHKKKIFIRNIPVYHEIVDKLRSGKENVVFFDTLPELKQQLLLGDFSWHGEEAIGEVTGWQRSAQEILQTIEISLNEVKSSHISERLRWYELVYCSQNASGNLASHSAPDNIAKRFASLTYKIVVRVLNNPLAYKILRKVWRLYKR